MTAVISQSKALQICEREFPNGLECLIDLFSINVLESSICVDGWCFREPDGAYVVRLNSNAKSTRKRFTLAHELAHFILGTPHGSLLLMNDVSEYSAKSREENQANELASEMLLPFSRVQEIIADRPINYDTVKAIAKKAKVSEVAVMLRLAKKSNQLGLRSPTAFHIKDGKFRWMFPIDSVFPEYLGLELHDHAGTESKYTAEYAYGKSKIIAIVPPNPEYRMVFAYLVDNDFQLETTNQIKLQKLKRTWLTHQSVSFISKLGGYMGAWAKKHANSDDDIETICQSFIEHYDRLDCWACETDHDAFTCSEAEDYIYRKFCEML